VRLLAVTGYFKSEAGPVSSCPSDFAAAREAGVDDHVAKPATIEELQRAMSP
jgi:CheY-like chemotaxis protein